MNDFEKKLSCTRVEDENGSVNGFCGKIALESFVDSNSIDISVINKPYNLVSKQICVILGVEIRLGRL
jgi:hypothetical protein